MTPTIESTASAGWSLPKSFHVSVAAEAIAAALFAGCGYDVSVQYGANQPEYDLIVANGEKMLKVSVKGSQKGAWGLCQKHLENRDYKAAIDAWLATHNPKTIFCLVQFQGVAGLAMPLVSLARPVEIAECLRNTSNGYGSTILYQRHSWGKRAHGAGTTDEIPKEWQFSRERIEQLLVTA